MSAPTQSFVEAARREKLKELRARGVPPFAYRYERTHTAAQAHAAFQEGQEVPVRTAGRIVALRPHGKTTFAHLEDATGRIQLYFRRDDLGRPSTTCCGCSILATSSALRGACSAPRPARSRCAPPS